MTTGARSRPLVVGGQGGDGGRVLGGRVLRDDGEAGVAAESRLQVGEARPQVPAADAVRREEEEQHRGGGLHHIDADGTAVGRDADDVAGTVVGRADGGRDGTQPAQDVGRRLGHETFDGVPGSVSSSVISTTLRPCPHQRQTTSSTWRDTTSSSSIDQVAADGEVVERLGRLRDRDVEAGEVAAGVAAVSREAHGCPTVVRAGGRPGPTLRSVRQLVGWSAGRRAGPRQMRLRSSLFLAANSSSERMPRWRRSSSSMRRSRISKGTAPAGGTRGSAGDPGSVRSV